jgi:tetratricopeptide (TPR) repeat protein
LSKIRIGRLWIASLLALPLTKYAFYLSALMVVALSLGTVIQSYSQKDKRKGTTDPVSSARLREAEFFFTEGEKYYILEDYAKALLYFQRVVELNPDNSAVHYKIAEVLSKSTKEEDLIKASASIENALRLERKNRYFYLLASNIYSSLSNFSKAEQALETMMREIKGTEDYLYELAAFYQYDHKPEEAIRIYEKAESALGINEVSSLQKQRLYLEQGKITEALAEGQKLIDAFPEEPRYVLGFAETLSQFKQIPRAIGYLENYLKDHPDAGNAKMLLAGLYRDNGQEQKSKELTLAAMSDPSVEVGSKVLMVETYTSMLSQNDAKKISDPDLETFALSLFETLKAAYPNDPNVHLAGGNLNLTLKKTEKAQQEYWTAIQRGSTSFDAWQRLLYLESLTSEFDSLIKHSEEAMELFPNQAMLFYYNGFAHLRKKNYQSAASSLEQAKKLSASNPNFVGEVSSLLGEAYQSAKDYPKSDLAYDEALAINPNNDIVLNNYSFYLAVRKENLEKAEKMGALLIKRNPNNANFLDTYAWVLYARGKYKEARKVMEKGIATGQAGAAHYEHYGDILFRLGNIDEAVEQWQKAKTLDSGNALIDKKIANRKIY